MPLQSSGSMSLSQIQSEFGGSNPISLSEYYRGGAYVPNTQRNWGVSTGGGIAMSQFFNTASFQVTYITTINANAYPISGATVSVNIAGSAGKNRAIILSRRAHAGSSYVTNSINPLTINGGGTQVLSQTPNTGDDGQRHTIHYANISSGSTSVNVGFSSSLTDAGYPGGHVIDVFLVTSVSAITIWAHNAVDTVSTVTLAGAAPNTFAIGNYFFNFGSNTQLIGFDAVISASVIDYYMTGNTSYTIYSDGGDGRYMLLVSFAYG